MTTGDGGTPFITCFENLICDQMIQNFPVTYYDVTNAYKIFGPNLTGLIAKTVCKDTTSTCWLLARYVEEATLRNAAVRIRGKTRIGKQPCSNSDFLRELARKCRANIRVAEAEHRKRFSAGQESQSEEDR